MKRLFFHLNDRPVEESSLPPTTTLLQYLRSHAGLPGTKEGCAEGDCGACTVAVLDSRVAAANGAPAEPTYRAVNSCLVFLPMLQGKRVYTVEGLRDGAAHHPAQRALAERLGS